MKAYRLSVNLKLGLIVFAGAIAVASLWYTNALVEQLRHREQSIIELWAAALAQVPIAAQQSTNPYIPELRILEQMLDTQNLVNEFGQPMTRFEQNELRRAVLWAQGMPPLDDLTFVYDAILEPKNEFDIPTILLDSTLQTPVRWWNVPMEAEDFSGLSPEDSARVAERLEKLRTDMLAGHEPIAIDLTYPDPEGGEQQRFVQYMLYGESELVRDLRRFPFVQLLFVSLFVLVGYLGFSYVRRSEQSSLWVGMAKEAAHQLGTPISSLMGWLEVLRMPDRPPDRERTALDEIEKDIGRLQRVTARFSDIGSLPKLEVQSLGPVMESITEYMRQRLPARDRNLRLTAEVDPQLRARLNPELFEWVIENLIKNAIDAIDGDKGSIAVSAESVDGRIRIDVTDTGKGIDRRDTKHIFKPGYSSKKRGWGLGLSLAKRIVEDYHGGSLILHSTRPGEGTTFRIELPAAS